MPRPRPSLVPSRITERTWVRRVAGVKGFWMKWPDVRSTARSAYPDINRMGTPGNRSENRFANSAPPISGIITSDNTMWTAPA